MNTHSFIASATRLATVLTLSVIFSSPDRALFAAPEGTLLSYFDKLPGKHFAGFSGVNRRSLLKRKGAIVDYKNKFIEIPGSAEQKYGDLYLVQIKLFPPNAKEPLVAVSRLVWGQTKTPGTLDFYYGYNDAGGLRKAAATTFPFKLKKLGVFENAYLSHGDLTIHFSLPETETTGQTFIFNKNYKVGQSAFIATN